MLGGRTSLSFTQTGQGPRRSERQQKLLHSAKNRGDEVMSGTHYAEDSGEEIDPRESEMEDRTEESGVLKRPQRETGGKKRNHEIPITSQH